MAADQLRRFSVLAGLQGCQPGWIGSDAAAGLAIAAVALPIAIAYPAIADLPELTLPRFDALPLDTLGLGALTIFLVGFGSGIVTACRFAAGDGNDADANRELTDFGDRTITSALLVGFAVTGADSRTDVRSPPMAAAKTPAWSRQRLFAGVSSKARQAAEASRRLCRGRDPAKDRAPTCLRKLQAQRP